MTTLYPRKAIKAAVAAEGEPVLVAGFAVAVPRARVAVGEAAVAAQER